MAYFSSLLFYTVLGSIVILLTTGAIPKLKPWNKLATAIALTFLALLWAGLPHTWRWVMSAWSPGAVLQGWFVLDMRPELWQLGTVIGFALASTVWLEVAQKRVWIPLSGVMLVIFLCVTWMLLLSGTLLMTLAMWAIFDLVWSVASLMAGARSQRVLLATAVQGVVSILLWSVTLFLLRNGDSGLWWLLNPNEATITLLLLAVMIRTGAFGFQLVIAENPGPSGTLSSIHIYSVLTGVVLAYRLLSLPVRLAIPDWSILWCVLSCFWYGISAWVHRGTDSRMSAAMTTLMAIVTAGLLTGNTTLLMQGIAVWTVALFILMRCRRYDRDAFAYSWLAWLAALVLIGIPLTPVAVNFLSILGAAHWSIRIAVLLGLVFSTAALFRELREPVEASSRIPIVTDMALTLWPGLALLVGLFALSRIGMQSLSKDALYVPLLLWFMAVLAGTGLARVTTVHFASSVNRLIRPLTDFWDLEWLYQALWDGADIFLGVVRITAEVVEGRGSLIWSVLILLLVMMVVAGQ